MFSSPASKAGPDARQEFREREGFNEVVISAAIESSHALLDCIASGQDENRGLQSAFSQCGQHLEPVAAWKHEIQNDEVEFLGIHEEEPFFSGGCDNDLVFLTLQSLSQRTSHLRFVFNHEDAHLAFSLMHLGQVFYL